MEARPDPTVVWSSSDADAVLVDALVDTAQCLICVLDPEGRIVRFNEVCEQATGFTAGEVVGRDARDVVIPPEECEAFGELLQEVWSTFLPSPQVGHWLTRTGDRIPIAWSNRPLPGPDGRPALLVTAGHDLRERERKTAELERLHDALEYQLAEVARLADERAALRRVATLVASSAPPEALFAAVSEETVAVLDAPSAAVFRFDGDHATVVGRAASSPVEGFHVGLTFPMDPSGVVWQVWQTGRSARIDSFEGDERPGAQRVREAGLTAAVAAPIAVTGRPWGALVVAAMGGGPLPDDAEARLRDFAHLVSLAVASAQGRADLVASRVRILRAGDDARRRLERNLHDGAQQRLVSLAISLRLLQKRIGEDHPARTLLDAACADAEAAIDDLRQLANGLHPPILTQGGLRPALASVAARLPLEVELDVAAERLPEDLEAALYFVVSEALTNTVKHAGASKAAVEVRVGAQEVEARIADDGRGGADPDGSGIWGLRDRVEALGGALELASPPGGGTRVVAHLPLPSG
jgi:PAS domain S-box-containing protein